MTAPHPSGPGQAVTARFCILDDRGACVGEDALAAMPDAPPGMDVSYCEGAIHLHMPDGREVKVEDDLPALVQNLCLLAARTLASKQVAVMPYFSMASEMSLTPQEDTGDGDMVHLSGELIPDASAPRAALIAALIGCAVRFIAYLDRVAGTDPDGAAVVAHLRTQAEAVRASPGMAAFWPAPHS